MKVIVKGYFWIVILESCFCFNVSSHSILPCVFSCSSVLSVTYLIIPLHILSEFMQYKNTVVKWLTCLLCVHEVLGSYLSSKARYQD
jgi:hypothetical protein